MENPYPAPVIKHAVEAGWTADGEKHLCPNCSGKKKDILEMLNAGVCPDCGGKNFLSGPEAGIMQNIKCATCGSEFNYCPPCAVLHSGCADRIGEKGGVK